MPAPSRQEMRNRATRFTLRWRDDTRERAVDVCWPGYVAAEHKSRGSDLSAAMDQALDHLPTIPPEYLFRLVVGPAGGQPDPRGRAHPGADHLQLHARSERSCDQYLVDCLLDAGSEFGVEPAGSDLHGKGA